MVSVKLLLVVSSEVTSHILIIYKEEYYNLSYNSYKIIAWISYKDVSTHVSYKVILLLSVWFSTLYTNSTPKYHA